MHIACRECVRPSPLTKRPGIDLFLERERMAERDVSQTFAIICHVYDIRYEAGSNPLGGVCIQGRIRRVPTNQRWATVCCCLHRSVFWLATFERMVRGHSMVSAAGLPGNAAQCDIAC